MFFVVFFSSFVFFRRGRKVLLTGVDAKHIKKLEWPYLKLKG